MSRVLIVDDHPLARMAIQFIIENEGHDVVAETGDGVEALHLVEKFHPDIIILDIDIINLSGLEVVRILRKRSFPGIIIMISAKAPDFYASRSAQNGADGYISKKNNLPEIVTAIKAAENGYGYFPLKRYDSPENRKVYDDQERLSMLSAQEFVVFQHIIRGYENIKIASIMKLSNKTISTYKTRLMEKLGCKSQLDLFDFARRNDLE
ncbi:response regulator [Type-D symbiont of Plautia stali]|uniref:response regulator n=1 Tax=Type-D symbiont of Plautia stali TaxID=1560356 RepID=UPI00073F1467|nr:response regulator [Type-D symbiont of Plautia stali]